MHRLSWSVVIVMKLRHSEYLHLSDTRRLMSFGGGVGISVQLGMIQIFSLLDKIMM